MQIGQPRAKRSDQIHLLILQQTLQQRHTWYSSLPEHMNLRVTTKRLGDAKSSRFRLRMLPQLSELLISRANRLIRQHLAKEPAFLLPPPQLISQRTTFAWLVADDLHTDFTIAVANFLRAGRFPWTSRGEC